MRARGAEDRIEKEGIPFFESIRDSYLQLAAANPGRFCVINANQTEAQVIADVTAAVTHKWDSWL
jgi:dTMP kinase